MKKVNENLGDVQALTIHYKGTGNPADIHEIVGVSYHKNNVFCMIGECHFLDDCICPICAEVIKENVTTMENELLLATHHCF